jgi:peptidoglycan/xylan/chitin deacetylase (PgdA/CDA1 family)
VILTACTGAVDTASPGPSVRASPPTSSGTPTGGEPTDASEPTDAEPVDDPAAELSDEDLQTMQVNELGRVLVAEWHEIQDTTADYKTSLSRFKEQLQDLYERGYRPISVDEFITGAFPIPAGTSPVLLTFDDSYKEHLFFGDDGNPHPDSVVGILQGMEQADPTWRARASFAYYWPYPFRETDPDLIATKLRYLVDNGFDLSNHSHTHDNLAQLPADELVANLAESQRRLAEIVGEYAPRTLTLPFGMFPEDQSLVVTGTDGDTTYNHELVFLVGWMPTRSPHHVDFDPVNVFRVPAHGPWGPNDPDWDGWLEWLDEQPGRRFVSDGDPDVVTFPDNFAEVYEPRLGLTERTYPPPVADPEPTP